MLTISQQQSIDDDGGMNEEDAEIRISLTHVELIAASVSATILIGG